jgi:menaquinone-dependent protoporphyrinogen oxidase
MAAPPRAEILFAMTVLVTAASRHGATREIAEAIARELAGEGLDVELLRAEDVSAVDGYEAVVLGSAVYMGSWLEPATRIVDEHAAALAERPTWLFSSGPLGEPLRPKEEDAVRIEPILEATRAREHRLLAGKLDKRGLGFGERAVVAAFRAPEGDFRDWDEIAAWSREIASALRG